MKRKFFSKKHLFCFALTMLFSSCLMAQIYNPQNGHYYLQVDAPPGRNWDQANSEATNTVYLGIRGHLATITSPEEEAFIAASVVLPPYYPYNGNTGLYWIGGLANASSQTNKEWSWITGEPWNYTAWNTLNSNEPNNTNTNEDRVHLYFFQYQDSTALRWNDAPRLNSEVGAGLGFLIEFEQTISVSMVSNMIQLKWSAPASNYALESTAVLPSTNWSLVTDNITTNGTVFSVQITPDLPVQFFRLRQISP